MAGAKVQRRACGHGQGAGTQGAIVIHPQRAVLQGRAPGVTVVARQDQCSARAFAQVAAAADQAVEGDEVGAGKGERAIVDDVTGNAAGEVVVADLQRAPGNRGAATVGVGLVQHGGTGTDLGNRTAA
ncbi:hypothetical protein D9M71_232080 [compost metagenome]